MIISKYTAENKKQWDSFIRNSKSFYFQHLRDYTEYHQHRFTDHSLVFSEDSNIISVLPANETNGELHSHQGLTHGGLILSNNIKQKEVLDQFDLLMNYCRENNLKKLNIKLMPYIYNKYPAEEVHYALFRNNAVLNTRLVSSVIDRRETLLSYSKGRKWSVKKSKSNNIEIKVSTDFDAFMAIEHQLLEGKYNVIPAHTGAEMALLHSRFPDYIKMYAIMIDGKVSGGTIIYLIDKVVKFQYICSTPQARELFALDYLIDHLIQVEYKDYHYFDFGVSTQQGGWYLENTLIQNKEAYGARAVCYDSYIINI